MNIALIGYGKMGKAIETIAKERGHRIALIIDQHNLQYLTKENLQKIDVAIEFTGPHSAVSNLSNCINAGTPVVCGSTGWLQQWDEIKNLCQQQQGALIYASNFSVGVNLFFELNKQLAVLMNNHPAYKISVEETHHTEKKDAPSGTAISLAEQILQQIIRKKNWTMASPADDEILISSKRIDPAPGTHTIKYSSAIDDIEITHTAHNRIGFATGAVLAAEFLLNKTGLFSMKDVLGI